MWGTGLNNYAAYLFERCEVIFKGIFGIVIAVFTGPERREQIACMKCTTNIVQLLTILFGTPKFYIKYVKYLCATTTLEYYS